LAEAVRGRSRGIEAAGRAEAAGRRDAERGSREERGCSEARGSKEARGSRESRGGKEQRGQPGSLESLGVRCRLTITYPPPRRCRHGSEPAGSIRSDVPVSLIDSKYYLVVAPPPQP